MYYHVEDTQPLMSYMPAGLDLMQGGLYTGGTLRRLIQLAEGVDRPFRKIWAADSFQGLPEDTPGLWENPDWPPGAFNICRDRGYISIEEALEKISEFVETKEDGSRRNNIIYVKGFFSESLTKELALDIGEEQISYLDVDVDIHKSSLQLLDFVFYNGLLVREGLIRFDDFNSTGNSAGERLAWAQVTNRYNIKYNILADNVFQVMNYE